eukprot:scaffold5240_cov116-Isochrysis_galbana.AAC.8
MLVLGQTARGRLVGKPIIGPDSSVCDVLEVEVVVPRVVRCIRFSHAAMHGWGLGLCRAEKHAVSVLTVIRDLIEGAKLVSLPGDQGIVECPVAFAR